jgi:chromosome segregation ATPase
VGEKGPELFVPKDKGSIIPAAELKLQDIASSLGRNISPSINIKSAADLKDISSTLSGSIEPLESAQQSLRSNLNSLNDVTNTLAGSMDPLESTQSSLKSNLITFKNIQDNFATSREQQEKQKAQTDKQSDNKKDSDLDLPAALSEAFETVLTGPAGFKQSIELLKDQLANSNNQQQGMLQEQINRLNELVSAMQDNVRASENIANVLQ